MHPQSHVAKENLVPHAPATRRTLDRPILPKNVAFHGLPSWLGSGFHLHPATPWWFMVIYHWPWQFTASSGPTCYLAAPKCPWKFWPSQPIARLPSEPQCVSIIDCILPFQAHHFWEIFQCRWILHYRRIFHYRWISTSPFLRGFSSHSWVPEGTAFVLPGCTPALAWRHPESQVVVRKHGARPRRSGCTSSAAGDRGYGAKAVVASSQ